MRSLSIPPLAGLVAGLAATLLAAGCSDSGSDDGGAAARLVRRAPQVERSGYMQFGDLTRAFELLGVELPDADDDEFVDVVLDVFGPDQAPLVLPPNVSQPNRLLQHGEFADELGWDLTDVTAYVETGAPPDVVTVMQGAFDAEAITDAIGEPDERDGGLVWEIGESGAIAVGEPTPARPLGESLRLFLRDDILVVTRTDEALDEGIEALDGDDVAADDEEVLAAARALDRVDATGGFISRGALRVDDVLAASGANLEEIVEQLDPLPRYDAWAIGAAPTDDADEPDVVIVLIFGDEDDATEAAEQIEDGWEDSVVASTFQPLDELLQLGEVTVEGATVTITAEPQRPSLWPRLFFTRDLALLVSD